MSWRAKLLPASYNNVRFFVQSHDATLGRRNAIHEYPLRDLPYAEDLGRRAREFTVEAFVLASAVLGTTDVGVRGDDYFAARDRLLAAIEKPGPATLVHPYLGRRQVVVTECRLRESTDEGGVARFTLTCVEAGQKEFPKAVSDTAGEVGTACDAAATAVQDDFANKFRATKVPAYIADSASTKVNDFIKEIRKQSAAFGATGADITSFGAQLDRLGDAVADLIRQPANLAADVVGVFVTARGIATNVRAALGSYRSLFDFGGTDEAVPQTTATRQLQESNRGALNRLVQGAAVLEAARAATQIDFANFDEATEIRDALAEQLDEQMATATDEVYGRLGAVRAAVVRDITARGADLARIVQYTPPATLPALVLAHQLYGDAARADEIVARNNLAHPGFVTGGQPLEVLTDA